MHEQLTQYFIWNPSPIVFSLGSFSIHWYGILFGTAFLLGYTAVSWMFRREGKPTDDIEDLFMYAFFGAVLGARLVHCFFYEPNYYLENPLEIFAIWKGGLASHGGGLGTIAGIYFFCRSHPEFSFTWLVSRCAVAVPLGGALIRTANFINSEIYGLPTTVPWAIIFSRIDMLPRHPSQLYEAACYLVIFIVLRTLYVKTNSATNIRLLLGWFFVLIFSARIAVEYTKSPLTSFMASLPLSMGQLLSIPFLVFGVYLLATRRAEKLDS